MNVNGGAMAIGHPLGATGNLLYSYNTLFLSIHLKVFNSHEPMFISGARCVATLLHEMKRRGKDSRYGVVSMCIGMSYSTTISCSLIL